MNAFNFFMVFFDSHGGAWDVCAPSHPNAKAFGPGPSGCARELTEAELKELNLWSIFWTPHSMAAQQGRVIWGNWDLLA